MDQTLTDDGRFRAGALDLSRLPRPWLRLAHQHGYDGRGGRHGTVRHIRDHEFIIQTGGDSWLGFPDLDGSIALVAGQVALLPPGLIHCQGQTRGHHIAIHFDLDPDPDLGADAMVCSHHRQVTRHPRRLWPLLEVIGDDLRHQVPLAQCPGDWDRWLAHGQALVETWIAGRHLLPGERLRCAGLLCDLVHDFCFGDAARADEDDITGRVGRVLTAIDIRDRQLGVAALARQAGCGETAFRRAVRHLTGTTPRAWLEQRRCDLALALLQQSDLTVNAVAAACGYDDPYHFSRVVRRRFGRSPSDLRRGSRPADLPRRVSPGALP